MLKLRCTFHGILHILAIRHHNALLGQQVKGDRGVMPEIVAVFLSK